MNGLKPRAEAMALGLTHYFTGKPCHHGHVAKRYTNHGTCTECVRIKVRERYYKDPEKWKAHGRLGMKRWVAANHETHIANVKAWQAANPEKVRAYKKTNKYKRRAVERDGITGSELMAWENAQKKVCYWCGVKCAEAYHVDHYTALTRGGAHEIGNLVISCPSCNRRKSAKDPYAFAAEVGRLF